MVLTKFYFVSPQNLKLCVKFPPSIKFYVSISGAAAQMERSGGMFSRATADTYSLVSTDFNLVLVRKQVKD